MIDKVASVLLDVMIYGNLVGIIIVFALAAYWSIAFVLMTKWISYSVIKLWLAGSYITMIVVFAIPLISSIVSGVSIEYSDFGTKFVRPFLFVLGGGCAAAARSRYASLSQGGEPWILKHKRR